MKRYRHFKAGVPIHVYFKANHSFILFYTQEDQILLFTIYSCLAKKYGIKVLAFCIMPNHLHAIEIASSEDKFYLFHAQLGSIFTKEYNLRHNRKGKLLSTPFGFAPKTVTKRIRDAVCYVANNPVVGGLTDSVGKFRWNLLPYYNNSRPFSEKLSLNKASHKLRCAIKLLDYWCESNSHLTYARQNTIFENLTDIERKQLLDKIIYRYNFLDYTALCSLYKVNFPKVISLLDLGRGNEFDLEDDYDNYASYHKMIKLLSAQGLDFQQCNFEKYGPEEIAKLSSLLRKRGYQERQICKFLHITF